jgi:hypothetical protein
MDMVERVARAIAGELETCAETYVDSRWTRYEDAARAAIAAMREPTEEMVQVGMEVWWDDSDYDVGYAHFAKAWRRMVDCSLGKIAPDPEQHIVNDPRIDAALTSSEKS